MTSRPPAVARVLERVTKTARAHDMFTPGDLVLVWVSGGPDSVCLLESLVRLRRLFKIRLAVFHLDHGLRADSFQDAAYVRRLVERHRLAVHVRTPTEPPPRGASVEMWARQERTLGAADVAHAIGATRSADGHTMDDQAETVLLGLVRGGGLDALGGIRPVNGTLVRPLLDVQRDEVEAFCRSLHLRPRRDPSNADTDLLRNAIRHEVLPEIERATGRAVTATFARTADRLRRDATVLGERAREVAEGNVERTDEGLAIPAATLVTQPEPIASRVVRGALEELGLPWFESTIDAVLDLARGRPGRRRDLVLGSTATRDREYVRIGRAVHAQDGPIDEGDER